MANRVKIKGTIVSIGDTVKVHHKIKESGKERTQVFEGFLIAIKGKGPNKSFTVRKIASHAIGVERIWPVECPSINKVEIKKHGDVRRAKLYYLRGKVGKKATKIKEKEKSKIKKDSITEVNDQKKDKTESNKKTKKIGKKKKNKPKKKDEKKKPGKAGRKSSKKTSSKK